MLQARRERTLRDSSAPALKRHAAKRLALHGALQMTMERQGPRERHARRILAARVEQLEEHEHRERLVARRPCFAKTLRGGLGDLAAELIGLGHATSARMVGKLLREMGTAFRRIARRSKEPAILTETRSSSTFATRWRRRIPLRGHDRGGRALGAADQSIRTNPHIYPRWAVDGPIHHLTEFHQAFGCELPKDTCSLW